MDIHIGTSGFSFPSWRAQVYPYTLKSQDMFDYYCRTFGFDCLEINSSFYNIPSAKSMASLARRSPQGFHFIAKLYQEFTHNTSDLTKAGYDRFQQGIQPLQEAGKLRGLLAQFPSSFLPTKENGAWLRRLRNLFAQTPLFVEFRHRAWDHPKIYRYLADHNIGYCAADLPNIAPLPQFRPIATTATAYLRFHGRNSEWYSPSTSRYDYSYSDGELSSLYSAMANLPSAPNEIFFFFNNCHGAAAVRAGRRLRELINQIGLPYMQNVSH